MNAKTTIRKVVFVAVWICIGGSLLTLLLAAISKKNKGQCKDYTITLKGDQKDFFINKNEAEQLLLKSSNGSIKGKSVASFNLHEMEIKLKRNSWINDAELYFDNRNVLHITLTEKEPIARVFSTTGNSFYIDKTGNKIPLSEKRSARVPVFTGFPELKKMNAADSILLNDVTSIANYFVKNPFWQSQVAQIDITAERNFEMIPVVGNHLVKLGKSEELNKKFNRLMVFYKQVLSKTGFDKYKVIDVQYAGQVVVSKYDANTKVDSLQLRRNVEKLLLQSMNTENDVAEKAMTPKTETDNNSPSLTSEVLKNRKDINPEKRNNPNPRLNELSSSISSRDGGGQAVKPSLPKPATDRNQDAKKEAIVIKPKQTEKKKVPKAVKPKALTEDENKGYN